MHQKIQKYYRHQKIQLERCIQKISNGIDDEKTVNLLRTSLKRLKSLFVFASSLSDFTEKKFDIECIKKLFKSAAVLRDYQVTEKIIRRKRKKEIYHSFLQSLKSNQETGRTILKTGVNEFNIKDLDFIFNSILSYSKFETKKNFDRNIEFLINSKLKSLSKHLTLCCDEKSFHKARIKVKEIVYFREIMSGHIERKAALSQMGVKMGRWHDRVVLMQIFTEFLNSSVENKSEDLARSAKKTFSDNKRKMNELKCELNEILKNETR